MKPVQGLFGQHRGPVVHVTQEQLRAFHPHTAEECPCHTDAENLR
jgi:hypothetical protein